MRKASLTATAMLASLLLFVPLAASAATSVSEAFTSFTAQSQLTPQNATDNGWAFTEDQGDPDLGITAAADGIDGQSLRASNAYADGNFGNWLFSERLDPAVTEDADGNKFTAEFEVATTTPNVEQAGLAFDVSPQSLDGARMSLLRFKDSPGGIDVYFTDAHNDGSFDLNLQQIADNLPRDGFTVRIELDLYTGPNNDVAQVFIDNGPGLIPMKVTGFQGFFAPVDHPDTFNKLKAGQAVPMKWKVGGAEPATTWEDYYRFVDESNRDANGDPLPQVNGMWPTRSVDSLIFQARTGGGQVPSLRGGGFLFDNVELTNTGLGTLPQGGAAGDASIYTAPIFTAKTINCDTDAEMDPLEEVAAPGASHLTYDATTGVWHYNWQTSNVQKGTCVKLTLNLTGDYALFKLIK
jgi:hypothetical protein